MAHSKITKNIRNSCGGAWNSERRIAQYYCQLTPLFLAQMLKARHARSTFGSRAVEKASARLREAHFEVKMLKTRHIRTTFGHRLFRQAQLGSLHQKRAKRCGVRRESGARPSKCYTICGRPGLKIDYAFPDTTLIPDATLPSDAAF